MRKPHRQKRLNRHLWGVAAGRTREIVRRVMSQIPPWPGRYEVVFHEGKPKRYIVQGSEFVEVNVQARSAAERNQAWAIPVINSAAATIIAACTD